MHPPHTRIRTRELTRTPPHTHTHTHAHTHTRHTHCRFFQDKRVRVSLFLSEGIQAPDGRIVLPTCTACDAGRVRVFGAGGRQLREERPPLAALQVQPVLVLAALKLMGFAALCTGTFVWVCWRARRRLGHWGGGSACASEESRLRSPSCRGRQFRF
jgi:hypothetical protein